MRDQPGHPSIVANNYQTIDVDVKGERGHRPPADRILPLARDCAVGTLDRRQREIRICSRWRDNVRTANAYPMNDPSGECRWTDRKKHSSNAERNN